MNHFEQWAAVLVLVFAIGVVGDGIEKKLNKILEELRVLNYKIDKK